MATTERWQSRPAAHDYAAAADYLGLLLDDAATRAAVRGLRAAAPTTAKAKDLLRASRLPLLPVDDPELTRDRKKVKKGELLSPVLLVRGDLAAGVALTVADGYHRICASYHLDEDADIPCRITAIPAKRGHPGSRPRRSPA